MNVLYVRETPRRYTEAEAKDALSAELDRLAAGNPACEFVLSDNGLTLYWRCADGFDYGIYSYTIDGCITTVWDGETSLLWRRWRADADESTQVVADPDLPRMPARPDAFRDGSAGPKGGRRCGGVLTQYRGPVRECAGRESQWASVEETPECAGREETPAAVMSGEETPHDV